MIVIKKNKNIKQNTVIVIAIIILTSITLVGNTKADPSNTILSIENILLSHNEIKTAKVFVYNVENLGSYKISISYDTGILDVLDVYYCDIDEVFFYKDTIKEILNITGYNKTGITSDEICIAEIKFKAIGSSGSSCDLIIAESEILDGNPRPVEIPHETSNGKAIIKKETSSGSGGGGGSNNQAPIADASLSQRQGIINTIITFNGSKSYDPDGTITGYRWDFENDGNFDTNWLINPITTHLYNETGEYMVKLQVKDNNEQIDDDIISIQISKHNNKPFPPTVVEGIKSGASNTDHTFAVISQDPDGDSIRYIINWYDNTENTITSYVKNNTKMNITHNWAKSGIYKVRLQAEDINNGKSENAYYVVFIDIDIIILDEINGYLIDNDQDGEYDQFFKPDTDEKIDLERKKDGTYLIDVDGDGTYDYQYNINNGLTVYDYSSSGDSEDEKNKIDIAIFYIIIIIMIIVFISALFIVKIKKESK